MRKMEWVILHEYYNFHVQLFQTKIILIRPGNQRRKNFLPTIIKLYKFSIVRFIVPHW